MERWLKEKGPVSTDPILSHTPAKSQEPPARVGGWGSIRCWQCGEVGHLKHECPTLKDKRLFWGECLNSPSGLERHSPTVHPNVEIESTTEEGVRVIGRTD